jgi:hypothetical protein
MERHLALAGDGPLLVSTDPHGSVEELTRLAAGLAGARAGRARWRPRTRKLQHDAGGVLEVGMTAPALARTPDERARLLVTTSCGAALGHGAPARCIVRPRTPRPSRDARARAHRATR